VPDGGNDHTGKIAQKVDKNEFCASRKGFQPRAKNKQHDLVQGQVKHIVVHQVGGKQPVIFLLPHDTTGVQDHLHEKSIAFKDRQLKTRINAISTHVTGAWAGRKWVIILL